MLIHSASSLGRYVPLQAGSAAIGESCLICGKLLKEGDRPSLVEHEARTAKEARMLTQGVPLRASFAHESCVYPNQSGDQ